MTTHNRDRAVFIVTRRELLAISILHTLHPLRQISKGPCEPSEICLVTLLALSNDVDSPSDLAFAQDVRFWITAKNSDRELHELIPRILKLNFDRFVGEAKRDDSYSSVGKLSQLLKLKNQHSLGINRQILAIRLHILSVNLSRMCFSNHNRGSCIHGGCA